MEPATLTDENQDGGGSDATQEAAQPADLAPLLASAAKGDDAAWQAVIDRYAKRVFALAKSRCRDVNVAEEITQSVFATIAIKLGAGEYLELGRFESWLFRVAANRVRDHVRRLRRNPAVGDPAALDTCAAAELERSAADPALDRLREAMSALAEADREVVELRHHGGLSFKQIAEVLGEPIGTLLARHHRALRKLRDMLEEPQSAERGLST
ncbi:MAG: sigma-70 family RNA polymerase sigma factor [Planctomycetes bacterium]|nr:sigma-70 family RNA polymerase sigma factor [Planctomycetota bacterium]